MPLAIEKILFLAYPFSILFLANPFSILFLANPFSILFLAGLYDENEFCWYNSLNHHFFHAKGQSVYKSFLRSTDSSLAVLIDPPFGARIELIGRIMVLLLLLMCYAHVLQ